MEDYEIMDVKPHNPLTTDIANTVNMNMQLMVQSKLQEMKENP